MALDGTVADFGRFAVKLQQLRVFLAVAEAGGIRRSSTALLRASSAVSRALAALEATLGQPLFERTGRGLQLSPAGEGLLRRARQIARELADARRVARGEAPDGSAAAPAALFHTGRLLVVVLLAHHRQMSEVVRFVGVTQPAVSAAVARVEAALGQRLFARSARGTACTALGGEVLPYLQRALVALAHAEAEAAALRGAPCGLVRIGALPLARTRLLPAALAALAERCPQLQLRSVESPYEELRAGLIDGGIDLIVGALRSPGADLVTEPLWCEQPALLAGRGHPLARRQPLSWADLAGSPWVLPRPGTPLRRRLREGCAAAGLCEPLPVVETGDLALLRGLLLSDRLLTVQYPAMLGHELAAGSVVVLPLALPGPPTEIGITTRRGARLSPGAGVVVDELRRQASLQRLPEAAAEPAVPVRPSVGR